MDNIFNNIRISLCTAAVLILAGCAGENESPMNGSGSDSDRLPLVIHATASGFDNPDAPETSGSRTPTEDGLITKFSTGDLIGLFALKDGEIVDGIDNLQLTYDAATSNWNPPIGTSLFHYEGVTYVAYYPYKSSISASAATTKTADGIKAFLYAHSDLEPKSDQQTYDNYTASDLMIAIATPTDDATSPVIKKILTLDLKHQFTLLMLDIHKLAPYKTSTTNYIYYPPASENNLDADAIGLQIGSILAYRIDDAKYRAIITPTSATTNFDGSYTSANSMNGSFKIASATTGFTTGGAYSFHVGALLADGASTTVRDIALGDFYYQNGSIAPGDEDYHESPGNPCLGVVFKVGAGSQDNASRYDGKLSDIHGYVVSLKQSWQTWGDNSQSWTNSSWFEYEGYVYTKNILEGMKQGKSFPACSWCVNYTPAPTGESSGWHFPSLCPVIDFTGNASTLNTCISKISGGTAISGSYLSATESGSDKVNNYSLRKTGDGTTYRASKTSGNLVRAILTF